MISFELISNSCFTVKIKNTKEIYVNSSELSGCYLDFTKPIQKNLLLDITRTRCKLHT